MLTKIHLIIGFLLIATFPIEAKAQDASTLYCIEPVTFKTETTDLKKIKIFEKPAPPIFYLRRKSQPTSLPSGGPSALKGNIVSSIDTEFPDSAATDEYVQLPTGEVLGHARTHFKPTPIYKQNPQTGLFEKFNITGEEKLYHIEKMVWSEVLGGVLMATQGKGHSKWNPDPSAVYLLKDHILTKIDGIDEWVTQIVDVPEFKLTILGTEDKDRLYAIDSQKKVHFIDELDLGKWIFFSKIVPLSNPDRILVLSMEAMGPYGGYFIINLKKENGVIIPDGIHKASDEDISLFKNRKDASIPKISGYQILKSPLPERWIAVSKDGIYDVDKDSNLKLIDNQKIITKRYSQNNVFLPTSNEVFIDAQNGGFLVKACN